jgi:hypothetical protein
VILETLKSQNNLRSEHFWRCHWPGDQFRTGPGGSRGLLEQRSRPLAWCGVRLMLFRCGSGGGSRGQQSAKIGRGLKKSPLEQMNLRPLWGQSLITEAEARALNVKETEYCYVLACAWGGNENDSICLERIFTKGGCEEIRLSWWKNGKQATRPADIDAVDWVPLFAKAVAMGVFNDTEKLGMLKALMK